MIAVLVLAAAAPLCAAVQVWDAWVYAHARIYETAWIDGFPTYSWYDIYNDPYDVYANPIECSAEEYYGYFPDRMRFTFDGHNLSILNSCIETVGNSSKRVSYLLLSGSWAVCGTVIDDTLIPDPHATLVGDHIKWGPNTPVGYTANLLLGYSFQGDGAGAYQPNPPGYGIPPVEGTLVVRTYSPLMPGDYPDSYSVLTHVFTATYVPEPSSVVVVVLGLVSFAARRKRSS